MGELSGSIYLNHVAIYAIEVHVSHVLVACATGLICPVSCLAQCPDFISILQFPGSVTRLYVLQAPAYAVSGFLIDRVGRRPIFVYALAECEDNVFCSLKRRVAALQHTRGTWRKFKSPPCSSSSTLVTTHNSLLAAAANATVVGCRSPFPQCPKVVSAPLMLRCGGDSGVRLHARLAAAAAGHRLQVWRRHGVQPVLHLH